MLKANIENRTVGAAMLLDNHNIQTIGTALVINGKRIHNLLQ